MDIDTKNKSTDGAVSFTMKHPFYLVFNPWCKGRFKGFETLVSKFFSGNHILLAIQRTRFTWRARTRGRST